MRKLIAVLMLAAAAMSSPAHAFEAPPEYVAILKKQFPGIVEGSVFFQDDLIWFETTNPDGLWECKLRRGNRGVKFTNCRNRHA